jgi:predicted deacylase
MRPFFTPLARAMTPLAACALCAVLAGAATALGAQTSKKKPSASTAKTPSKTKSGKKSKKSEKESAAPLPKHSYTLDTISVGTAHAKRGERVLGEVQGTASSGASARIPLTVIHGANPGPIVAYLSEAPDSTFSTVSGLNKLANLIDPAKVRGTVIIVPAFEPSATPVLIDQIANRADILLSLAGQEIADEFHPYGYWERTGLAAQDKATRALAMAFGLDVITVRDIDPKRADSPLLSAALSEGKSALLVVGGRSSPAAASATNAIVAGCLNVLGSIGVITRAVGMDGKVSWIGPALSVTSTSNGVFAPDIERGAKVRKGNKIGTFTDSATANSSDVVAPQDGIVTFLRITPTIPANGTMVTLATNYGPTPPPFTKPKP